MMFTPLQPFEPQQVTTACCNGVAQIHVSEEFEKLRQPNPLNTYRLQKLSTLVAMPIEMLYVYKIPYSYRNRYTYRNSPLPTETPIPAGIRDVVEIS